MGDFSHLESQRNESHHISSVRRLTRRLQRWKIHRQGGIHIRIGQGSGLPVEYTNAPDIMRQLQLQGKETEGSILFYRISGPKNSISHFHHARGETTSMVSPMHTILDGHFNSQAEIGIAQA